MSTNLNDSSLYDSALENLTHYSSFNESANNNKSADLTATTLEDSRTEFDLTLGINNLKNASHNLINMESSSGNSSTNSPNSNTEEVDPKSQLAQKTIFKSVNPNLSIIEISDSSINEDDAVYLIESSSNEETDEDVVHVPSSTVDDEQFGSAEKLRRKGESIIHSSKQQLNISSDGACGDNVTIGGLTTSKLNIGSGGNGSGINNEKKQTENGGGDMSTLALPPTDSPSRTPRIIKIYDTEEEFERNLPKTVTVLTTPFGSKVYLVGTAHFSEESQDDVSFVIRNVNPHIVMVELCPSRIHILKLDEKTLLEETKNFNLAKINSIIKQNGYINGIFFILLLHMSAQLAKELGMAPGGEFRRAFEEIHRIPGCLISLGDRPINVTLQRALRALSFWQTVKLVWRVAFTESISIKEVEECKQRDLLEKLMAEMAGEFPAFSDVFVRERDLYLCHSLQVAALPVTQADGEVKPLRVVGVVGIGHAAGIAKNWGNVNPSDIPNILQIPPTSLSTKIFKFTFKYGLIGLTLYGAFKICRPRLNRFL